MCPALNDFNKTTDKDETIVRISGSNDNLADVTLDGGVQKLETKATVIVEEIFGQDPYADSWFRIENTGSAGSTIVIYIAATTNDPSSPDRDRPAYNKTFTTIAGEVGNELELTRRIISELNADTNFKAYFKASDVDSNAIVHISSKYRGEFWEVKNTNDFNVTTTGSASITLGYNTLQTRGKPTELARAEGDPRQGILGISGSVTVTPGGIGDLFLENAYNSSSSKNLLVNGSVTPVYFYINSVTDKDIFIERIRFFGLASSIKFGQFLAVAGLTNGIQVTIKSDNVTTVLPKIYKTEDFGGPWTWGAQFEVFDQPGAAYFCGTFNLDNPFPIRASGTFTTNDYIEIKIQDNLTSVSLQRLEFIAFGFEKAI